ncbi:mannitol-1-phosphate 5-dehydrogenase [Jeotgalibacillus campisalis]|uniref:Mannitol-1-phosphate 5-dehydrogenase n=1 Tax=Jeotgalibacillus campisalis TaxID=220754 RepID=A0A0C2VXM2_9BACL|nr:mannitol-1-phosphate 5-dehydrogenase [Jeotgalibacillus campisalis]KIL48723.1 mannitol-1-phosphate 5-dehydrogenase [Jeotgalibacillus campisalis]
MKHAVHFGAGNIGRGFIGAVLSKAGYHVNFIDVNEEVINELNRTEQYTVQIASEQKDSFVVNHVSGIHSSTQKQDVYHAIAEADLITASVGPGILPIIAKDLAGGLAEAAQKEKLNELNIVACENMINGTSFLKEEIEKHLSEEVKQKVNEKIGFPNSAVDRIVPIQHHEDPLTVEVEPFFEWVIEQREWKGEIPVIEGVQFVEDLNPFIERKLLTVNTGHAAIAYLGLAEGFVTVDQAIGQASIKQKVEKVLAETSEFLVQKYGLQQEDHKKYVLKIIERFQNPYLSDELSRVGRAPLRKLGAKERLVYPAVSLMNEGKQPEGLIQTIAAALLFDEQSDQESQMLQKDIKENGVQQAFAAIAGLPKEHDLVQQVVQQFKQYQK